MEIEKNQLLFAKNDIFVSQFSTQKEVFEEISQALLDEGLVKKSFWKI